MGNKVLMRSMRKLKISLHSNNMYTKKPHEIELILEGGKKIGEILDTLVSMVRPGVSAWEIDQEAERLIVEIGGRPAFKGYRTRVSEPPFPSTICASVNAELVHGIATKDKILQEGDIFTIDIGMQYPAENGYYTDTAVTVPVGNIDAKTQKLLDVTRVSLEKGIEQAYVDKTIADIGAAVQQYVEPKGYGIVRDLVGHGVGHAVHEEPRVPNFYEKELETWILKPGVVIAIEPMITVGGYHVETADDGWTITTSDGSLNAHFEHTIVVTEDGPVIATKRPSE